MNKYLSLKFKVLSFILIIMVVYVHSYNIPSYLNDDHKISLRGYNSFIQHLFSQELLRTALRLFFAISGYLFFLNFSGTIDSYSDKLKKRAKLLFVPYLFWSASWILIYCCLQYFALTRSLFKGTLINELSFTSLLGTLFLHPIPFQLWSIKELIILSLLSPILYFLIKQFKYAVTIIFFIAWFSNLNLYIFSSDSISFFSFGATLSILKSERLKIICTKKHLAFVYIWLTICFFATILDYQNFQNKVLFDLLKQIGILFGIVSIWVLYDLLPKYKNIEERKFFKFFSFSFFIYAFHLPLITFVRAILFRFGNTEFISFSIYILAPIIVICFILVTGYYWKKVFPRFYKIISGGR